MITLTRCPQCKELSYVYYIDSSWTAIGRACQTFGICAKCFLVKTSLPKNSDVISKRINDMVELKRRIRRIKTAKDLIRSIHE